MKPGHHFRTSKIVAAMVGIMLSCMSSQAQSTYSPYSRFGLGHMQSGSSTAQMGMAQMGAAWTDRSHLNTINPAAAAFLTRTTFSGGFQLRSERIMEGDSTVQGELGGLNQIAFAMKRAGGKTAITFGIQPRSHSGYDVSQDLTDPVAEQYRINYSGNGGLTQSYIGAARRWEGMAWRTFQNAAGDVTDSVRIISSGTAIGARFEQVFGGLERIRTIDIGNPIYVDTRVRTEEVHRSAGFTFGMVREQLMGARFDADRKLTSSHLLRVGGVARLGRGHTIGRDTRWSSLQTLSTGPLEVDSVHSTEESFEIQLPIELILGVEWEVNTPSGSRWRLGVESRNARWSTLEGVALDPGVSWADDRGFSAGISLTPKMLEDARNAWQRATYSWGYRSQSGYMAIDQGSIATETLSFGCSIPMLGSRSGSSFNAAFTWQTTSAHSTEDFLRENAFGAMVGFTLHPFFKNQWLVPRRYD